MPRIIPGLCRQSYSVSPRCNPRLFPAELVHYILRNNRHLNDTVRCYEKGASVAEWLMSLTSNHFPLTAVNSNPDSFMWGSYPASLRTSMVLMKFKIMHGRAPPVKLEPRHMTYTVLVWRKTQLKQTNKTTMKHRPEVVCARANCIRQTCIAVHRNEVKVHRQFRVSLR
jgi:hypothetical protein